MSEVLAKLEKKGGGDLDSLLKGYTNLATDTLTGLTVTRYGTVINGDGFDVTGTSNGVKITRSDSRNYSVIFVWDDEVVHSQAGACQTSASLPSIQTQGTGRVYFVEAGRFVELYFYSYALYMALAGSGGSHTLKIYAKVLS